MLKFADARAAASAIQERPHVIDGDVVSSCCPFSVSRIKLPALLISPSILDRLRVQYADKSQREVPRAMTLMTSRVSYSAALCKRRSTSEPRVALHRVLCIYGVFQRIKHYRLSFIKRYAVNVRNADLRIANPCVPLIQMRFSLVTLARTVVNAVAKDDIMVRNVHWITGKGMYESQRINVSA